jgi:hypothetical protein
MGIMEMTGIKNLKANKVVNVLRQIFELVRVDVHMLRPSKRIQGWNKIFTKILNGNSANMFPKIPRNLSFGSCPM